MSNMIEFRDDNHTTLHVSIIMGWQPDAPALHADITLGTMSVRLTYSSMSVLVEDFTRLAMLAGSIPINSSEVTGAIRVSGVDEGSGRNDAFQINLAQNLRRAEETRTQETADDETDDTAEEPSDS